MQRIINVKELRATLPKIVESVRRGEEYTVLYRSRPAFRIVPIEAERPALSDLSDDPLYRADALGNSADGRVASESLLPDTAKLSRVGDTQMVQLPRDFTMPGEHIRVTQKGRQVILEPAEESWDELFRSLSDFPEDFLQDGRQQPDVQDRDPF